MTAEPMASASQTRRDAITRVTDPMLMRSVLERHLLPDADRRFQILECRSGALRRLEGCRFAVQYTLRLHEPATGNSMEQMVSGLSYRAGRTRAAWDSLRTDMPRTIGAALPPYAYVPDLDMLVQVFPHDYQLPGLASIMAGRPAEREVSLAADLGAAGVRIESWHPELVRYRVGMRATVRLTVGAQLSLPDRQSEHAYYTKVYRDADEARQAFELLQNLKTRADAESVRFAVPAPIALSTSLGSVIQSHVPGIPLPRLLRRGRVAMQAIRATARAVADLHGLALDVPFHNDRHAPRSLQIHLNRLARSGTFISTELPDLASEVVQIITAVKAGITQLPIAPIHGDLKPDHVFVAGDRISIIDFDDMHVSDPMLDVANMELGLARLQRDVPLGGDSEGTLGHAFVESYLAYAPEALRVRLPLYRAMVRVGEAARLKSGSDPRWRDRIGTLVREARAAVSQSILWVLQIGLDRNEIDEPLAEFLTDVELAAPDVLLLAALVGFILAGRAVAPGCASIPHCRWCTIRWSGRRRKLPQRSAYDRPVSVSHDHFTLTRSTRKRVFSTLRKSAAVSALHRRATIGTISSTSR